MNSLCESVMVFIPPESVVAVKAAGDPLKEYTLRELVSVTCADDVVIAMFADMTVSGFITVPLEMLIPSRCLMEQWPNTCQRRTISSVRKLTLKFPKSEYDRAAMTIDTPFVAAVPPENRCRLVNLAE